MRKFNFKKFILIILFILVALLLGYLIYLVFFKAPAPPAININLPPEITAPGLPTSPPGVTPKPTETVTGLPGALGVPGIPSIPIVHDAPQLTTQANGGIVFGRPLVNADVQDLTLTGDGVSLQYYDKGTGQFYRIDPNGTKQLLTDKIFKNVETVSWSPNSQKAVMEFPDGSNIVYNFQTKKQVTLPQHWKDFDFSPDSSNLVFKDMKLDQEYRWLAISSDEGKNKKLIETLGSEDEDVVVSWSPNNEVVALYREGYDMTRSKIYFVGLHDENYKSVIVQGRNPEYIWSPQGSKLLYSVYNSASNYEPTLWITNSQGELIDTGKTDLGLNTWASKCTFSDGQTIYCGVPKEIAKNAGLAPEFNDYIGDNIYKIDLKSMKKTLIAEPLYETTIDQLFVSKDNKYLYYTDKNDGSLKMMDL